MCEHHDFSRRRFIQQLSLGAMGTILLPWHAQLAFGDDSVEDPRFFVMILFPNGMDPTYLFDARPLEMTQAGKIQNYIGAEPEPWLSEGAEPQLATRLTAPLRAFKDRFSVLNGVMMAQGFEGHDQNLNFLFAGDPFGGESFIPHLNTAPRATPIDAVQSGRFFGNFRNSGNIVPLGSEDSRQFVERLRNLPQIDPARPAIAHILNRLNANAMGNGVLSAGTRALLQGFGLAPSLRTLMADVQLPAPAMVSSMFNTPSAEPSARPDAETPEATFVGFAAELFRRRVTRSLILVPTVNRNIDTHDSGSAKLQPLLYGEVAATLASVFQKMIDTPFDATRSLMDVTTFMVGSEFARTMRQVGRPIDDTGSDHNPLTNTFLIGGKGIRGGQVIGASDFRSSTAELSGAHVALDRAKLKLMGRPFDFTTGRSRTDLPETFKSAEHLTFASVANSIYSSFGVNVSRHRTLRRNGPPAPTIPGLLT